MHCYCVSYWPAFLDKIKGGKLNNETLQRLLELTQKHSENVNQLYDNYDKKAEDLKENVEELSEDNEDNEEKSEKKIIKELVDKTKIDNIEKFFKKLKKDWEGKVNQVLIRRLNDYNEMNEIFYGNESFRNIESISKRYEKFMNDNQKIFGVESIDPLLSEVTTNTSDGNLKSINQLNTDMISSLYAPNKKSWKGDFSSLSSVSLLYATSMTAVAGLSLYGKDGTIAPEYALNSSGVKVPYAWISPAVQVIGSLYGGLLIHYYIDPISKADAPCRSGSGRSCSNYFLSRILYFILLSLVLFLVEIPWHNTCRDLNSSSFFCADNTNASYPNLRTISAIESAKNMGLSGMPSLITNFFNQTNNSTGNFTNQMGGWNPLDLLPRMSSIPSIPIPSMPSMPSMNPMSYLPSMQSIKDYVFTNLSVNIPKNVSLAILYFTLNLANSSMGELKVNVLDTMDNRIFESFLVIMGVFSLLKNITQNLERYSTKNKIRLIDEQMHKFMVNSFRLQELINSLCLDVNFDVTGDLITMYINAQNAALESTKKHLEKSAAGKVLLMQLREKMKQTDISKDALKIQGQQAEAQKQQAEAQEKQAEALQKQAEIAQQSLDVQKENKQDITKQADQMLEQSKKTQYTNTEKKAELSSNEKYFMEMTKEILEEEEQEKAEQQKKSRTNKYSRKFTIKE